MSLSFLDKIDAMIADMQQELKKVRSSKVNPKYHTGFVNEKINETIRSAANSHPDDPVKSLGLALSKVGDLISDSFENITTIEKNIIVTINAYSHVREALVAHENEIKQRESQIEQADQEETGVELDSENRQRKIGTRPVDKLKKRRTGSKKSEEKTVEKATKKRSRKKKPRE